MSFFIEGAGNSMMRLMGFVSLLIGGAIAIIGLFKGVDLTHLSLLVGVFVGAAFGGKAAQKFAEIKNRPE